MRLRVHRWISPVVPAVLLIAALLVVGCESKPAATPGPKAATPEEFRAAYGLEGKVALVQFGMVGCPLSGPGLEKMMAIKSAAPYDRVTFVRVDTTSDQRAADAYFKEKSPAFAVHRDTDCTLAKAFDATAWPTYVLLDKFGHLRYRGPWPEDAKLAAWAAALLDETADPGPGVEAFGLAKLDIPKLLDETKLPDLKGAVAPLRDRLGKAGLLVVFVDTKCPYSGAAMGDLPGVAAVLAKHGVPAVAVNLGEAKSTVGTFYEKKDLGGPVIYDTTKATEQAWAVTQVPTVVMVDSSGGIAYRGKAVWKDLGGAAERSLGLAAGTLKFATKGTEFG